MRDKIRDWFIQSRMANESFPDYPEEDDGGSAFLFDPQPTEEELAEKAEEAGGEAASPKKEDKEKDKDEGKKKKGKKGKKKKKADAGDDGPGPGESAFIENLRS